MPRADRSPVLRLAWLPAIVGLQLAATVSAVYVASQLQPRADEMTSMTPTLTLTLEHPAEVTAVARR